MDAGLPRPPRPGFLGKEDCATTNLTLDSRVSFIDGWVGEKTF
jgi:hypothetical protein